MSHSTLNSITTARRWFLGIEIMKLWCCLPCKQFQIHDKASFWFFSRDWGRFPRASQLEKYQDTSLYFRNSKLSPFPCAINAQANSPNGRFQKKKSWKTFILQDVVWTWDSQLKTIKQRNRSSESTTQWSSVWAARQYHLGPPQTRWIQVPGGGVQATVFRCYTKV